jgi:ABC-type Fe3+ transport system permease subunit
VCDGQTVAGVLFFWSYMLLVFLILLNFLLAIIVDAFSEIKGATHEQTGKPTDESAVHRVITTLSASTGAHHSDVAWT